MPEPILVAISAALAGKAITSLYDFVRTKFATRKEAAAALEAAQGAAPDSPEVQRLATELARTEAADPEFGAQLRTQWQAAQQTGARTGNMSISGTMDNTKFVQAQNIHGDINFG
ncbi:hypothetical protein ALI144C_20835 [Actinosynnema sp. ALI-1.44]|uniref:hypothetical protein n=1 Tax=Actinosynnema sp. ALI-1.44 TaxID=1933779 RepID=UPI00097C5A6D|nr:hypothetical protein [Actinosynnema sp. ALI-1.44]ONI81013.1 hypothetical protein ALI144C_20835 [Actinosynnema sp. ALI-1.44]